MQTLLSEPSVMLLFIKTIALTEGLDGWMSFAFITLMKDYWGELLGNTPYQLSTMYFSPGFDEDLPYGVVKNSEFLI